MTMMGRVNTITFGGRTNHAFVDGDKEIRMFVAFVLGL